jgi:predicted ABC-type transport system involved in lysophospholipase L1 biosynthesis ATPase subunit
MAELVLELVGVGQGYRREREWWQVLSGVSLSVGEGEFVGILGGKHEGKTTLLVAAAGLAVPEDGKVLFEGRDLAKCSEDERTELLGDRIAWMPREDFAEFGVLEYVALPLAMGRGPMDGAEDVARAALERVGAKDCVSRAYEALSDWERLLVTFARAYATRPRLMVIDDLLDGLGAGGTREAGELLLGIAGELQCGVLAGASDMSALLAAHQVFSFDGEGGMTAMPESPDNLFRLHGPRHQVTG